MQKYRILKTLPIGAGAIVQLDEAQARSRNHRLESLGEGRYRAIEPMSFKAGDVLGIEGELPKVHADFVEELAGAEPAAKKEPAAKAAKKADA